MTKPHFYPSEIDRLVKELYLVGVRLVVYPDRVVVIGRLPLGYRSRLRQCEAMLRGIRYDKVVVLHKKIPRRLVVMGNR